jgi:hypothetical protein
MGRGLTGFPSDSQTLRLLVFFFFSEHFFPGGSLTMWTQPVFCLPDSNGLGSHKVENLHGGA